MDSNFVKIIAITNSKFKVDSFLGIDIIKQYIMNNTNFQVESITYDMDISMHIYHVMKLNEASNGNIVCEIGDLVNFLQLLKNIKDDVEDLTKGFTNLTDQQGWAIKKIKYDAENLDINNTPVVGFSILYISFFYLSLYAAILKRRNPNIKIVFGGYHMTISDNIRQFVYKSGLADVVVIGDGCKTLVSVLENNEISGIIEEPFDYNITLPEYTFKEREIEKDFSCITSVGCRFNCHFCASKREFIEYDIDYIEKYIDRQNKIKPIKYINFADDCINPTIDRGLKVCSLMKKFPDIEWVGHFVCSQFNDTLVKELQESKCRHIFVGTESFSNDILHVINKGFETKKSLETIDKLCNAGIYVTLGIIVGMPCETEQRFIETYETLKHLINKHGKFIRIGPTELKLFPGSKIYNRPEKFNLIIKYWSKKIINQYWKYDIDQEFPELMDIIKKIPFTVFSKDLSSKDILSRLKRLDKEFKDNYKMYNYRDDDKINI